MMMMAKDPEHYNITNLANWRQINTRKYIEVNCFRSIDVSSISFFVVLQAYLSNFTGCGGGA